MKKEDQKLKEIQSDLYDLMLTVHEFCVAHGIEYSLTGGSLLGAIRHNGFIPWDDDLDIMMTRGNYEKFKKCYEKEGLRDCIFERDQWVYRVRKSHRVKGYVPSIDFFVIDRAPVNPIVSKIQVFLLMGLQGMLRTNEKEGKYSFIYRVLIAITEFIGKFISKDRLFNWYDRISQWGRKKKGREIAIFDDRFKLIGLRYDASLVKKYINHTFEQTEFRIIERYDDYLTTQFGDYMQLPPKEDRVPQHIF